MALQYHVLFAQLMMSMLMQGRNATAHKLFVPLVPQQQKWFDVACFVLFCILPLRFCMGICDKNFAYCLNDVNIFRALPPPPPHTHFGMTVCTHTKCVRQ